MSRASAKSRGLFINLTRRKSKQEIKKIEQARGERLSKEARKKIIRKNAKKAKIYTTIAITSFLLGGTFHNKANQLLEAGKTEITIDADQYKDGINIDHVTNDREIFLNGIRVELNEINKNEELEQGVITEIENLKNSDEVLNYIKQIYLNEYKQRYGGEATLEDVKLHKYRDVDLYKDFAQNGDEIIREGESASSERIDSTIGLLTVLVQDGDENYTESVIYDGTEYKNVYEKNQEVAKDEESILEDIGAIVEHGIDYYSGFIDEKESDIYKQRFINAVTEYKYKKIQEIVEPSTENVNQQGEDETDINRS